MPAGLSMAARLENPLFTPSTKAEQGTHDENIDFAECEKLMGSALAGKARDAALQLYSEARAYAAERGFIFADT